MASTEGAPIPRVYGRARLAGEVIWATQLEEEISSRTETSGGAARAARAARRHDDDTTYSYFANFAVGLCEGPIGARQRASGPTASRSISTSINFRIYNGSRAARPPIR